MIHGLGLRAVVAAGAVCAATLAGAPAVAQPSDPRFPPGGEITRYTYAELFDVLSPAVVNIRTRQRIDGALPQFPPGSPLERFNEDFRGPGRTESSLGSGFVIARDGVIVTNNHVIEDADEIEIAFPDGETLEARVVGRDPATDLAVLQIEADGPFPFVRFGDSDGARVGEPVLAIGNPFGLNTSLSLGIVSARDRDIESGNYDSFIQTDAAINRGNSGGPLFNLDGEVIGVNSVILSPTGASVGIGFAIPAELAESVVDQLLEFGETRRGWIGVSLQAVTQNVAADYGLNRPEGALISNVVPGGPADSAGLEIGDVIIAFDGRQVEDDRTLPRIVADTRAGREVVVEYRRQRQRGETRLTVAELEDGGGSVAGERDRPGADTVSTVLGLTVSALSNVTRQRYGITEAAEGVVVVSVAASSDANGKISVGDVIEEIANRRVTSTDQFADLARNAAGSGAPVTLLVNRDGEYRYAYVDPVAAP